MVIYFISVLQSGYEDTPLKPNKVLNTPIEIYDSIIEIILNRK
jgi:hypothetical protein